MQQSTERCKQSIMNISLFNIFLYNCLSYRNDVKLESIVRFSEKNLLFYVECLDTLKLIMKFYNTLIT